MVITEYLTKYPYAVPVRTKTAEEISRKLWIFITMFGPPKIMGSDKGKEFVNQLVTQLCNACGIEHKVTSAYHPQANGHTEKFNDTLINMLKKHAEENPDNWDKWLPFVLLAYRTRVHTTTGHTPFELMFGRTMNEFDDYSFTQDPVNERIIEIKQMVECTHPKVLERIKEKQEKQNKYQDSRNTVENEKLDIGDKVTIRSMKIQGKLQPHYHGIYKIHGKIKAGNYYLINSEQVILKESYPRSRLKRVPNDVDEKYIEMEKILNSRKINNKFQYLVKWKNIPEEEATWEFEEKFDSTELIEDYWGNKHEIGKDEVITVNLVENAQPKQSMITKQSPIGNFNQLLLIISLLFTCVFRPATAFLLEENFRYCEIHDNKAVWDLPKSCQSPVSLQTPLDSKFHILNKKSNEINGKGWSCTRKISELITWTDWLNNKHQDSVPSIIYEDLSREDCLEMVRTKKCYKEKMYCDNGYCSTNIKRNLVHYYLQRVANIYTECEAFEVNIISENKDHKIITNERTFSACLSKDYFCKLKNSIIVWEDEIVHDCPFSIVKSIQLETIGKALMNRKENKYFELLENITICNNIQAWKTAEGLTQNDEAL